MKSSIWGHWDAEEYDVLALVDFQAEGYHSRESDIRTIQDFPFPENL